MQLIKFMRSLTPNPRYLRTLLLASLVMGWMPMIPEIKADEYDYPIGLNDTRWKLKEGSNGKFLNEVDEDNTHKILEYVKEVIGEKQYKELLKDHAHADDDTHLNIKVIYKYDTDLKKFVYDKEKMKKKIQGIFNTFVGKDFDAKKKIDKKSIEELIEILSDFYKKRHDKVRRGQDGSFDATFWGNSGLNTGIINYAKKGELHPLIQIAYILQKGSGNEETFSLKNLIDKGAGVLNGIGHLLLLHLNKTATKKVLKHTLFWYAFRTHFDSPKGAQVGHVWADVHKQYSSKDIDKKMEEARPAFEAYLRQEELLNYLGSVQFLFKTVGTVALLLVVFTLCSELFKFIREVIARAFFSLEVIEESNFPRNFWQAFSEWVRRLLRRKPIKYVVRWKEIVLPKEIKDSIEKRYKHIQKTIELNMKLTSVERKAGNGEIVNSLIFNGPTGTGKTLIALSIAKRLANKGLVRYAKISASNVSKGTAQEMTIALEKINRKALAYYNRTGKPTGLVMNEFLDMAESRFGQDRTEQTRHFVQKVLQLIDGVGAPHLFIIGTSNYYTKERLAKIDDAVLSRFASRYMFPIGDLPDDLWIELAKKTFIRLARQHKAELRGNFMAPIEDNIQFLRDKGMHGGGLYTNRQLVAFVTEIVMNLRFERVEKKKKKLVITQDDVAEAVEELSRLKGVDYFASDEGYDSDEDEG